MYTADYNRLAQCGVASEQLRPVNQDKVVFVKQSKQYIVRFGSSQRLRQSG